MSTRVHPEKLIEPRSYHTHVVSNLNWGVHRLTLSKTENTVLRLTDLPVIIHSKCISLVVMSTITLTVQSKSGKWFGITTQHSILMAIKVVHNGVIGKIFLVSRKLLVGCAHPIHGLILSRTRCLAAFTKTTLSSKNASWQRPIHREFFGKDIRWRHFIWIEIPTQ